MPAEDPGFHPGQLLPGTKYRIIREVGAGGMGIVYQVEKPPQIQGVLKLMAAELATEEVFRKRFLDEVHVLAQLEHPNIVRVFDYDSLSDGTPYYVMELLHGRTVRDVLATLGRVPPRVAFEITRQLCEALHCAHTHRPAVVHRDIKPENIFLHAPRHGDPVVKLIDFGVVAIEGHAHDGTFVGTWKYAAPEQIRGERATPATDLYAVGLVLYEMLAGAGPFDHIDTGQLISQAHLRDAPRPITSLAPWVPPSIVELIDTALAKDPSRRPASAHAFAERLYELEWASDGHDPAEQTSEGPLRRVLSSVSAAMPQSVPKIQVPATARHKGPTRPGMGGRDEAPPDEDDLLAALVARPDVEMGSRKRRSGPGVTPMPGAKIVVRPSGDVVAIDASPRPGTAATMDQAPTAEPTDTFTSQQSEPRAPRASKLLVPLVVAGACVVATVAIGVVVVKWRENAHREATSQPATTATTAAASPTPAAVPGASAASSSAAAVASASAVTAVVTAEPSVTTPSTHAAAAHPAGRRPAKPSAAKPEAPAPPPPATTTTRSSDDGYLRDLR